MARTTAVFLSRSKGGSRSAQLAPRVEACHTVFFLFFLAGEHAASVLRFVVSGASFSDQRTSVRQLFPCCAHVSGSRTTDDARITARRPGGMGKGVVACRGWGWGGEKTSTNSRCCPLRDCIVSCIYEWRCCCSILAWKTVVRIHCCAEKSCSSHCFPIVFSRPALLVPSPDGVTNIRGMLRTRITCTACTSSPYLSLPIIVCVTCPTGPYVHRRYNVTIILRRDQRRRDERAYLEYAACQLPERLQ